MFSSQALSFCIFSLQRMPLTVFSVVVRVLQRHAIHLSQEMRQAILDGQV